MGYLSTKSKNTQAEVITFEGGINLSEPSTNIANNELQECLNFFYKNQEQFLTTRDGIRIVDVPAMANPIDKLYEYSKDETSTYLIAVSNGQMFYLKTTTVGDVDTLSWELIGSCSNPTILPSFTTFTNKLIIADRGTSLRYWDGTTLGNVSNSLPYSTIVEQIQGKLIVNSEATGELDTIYFSGPYDMTSWNTGVSGTAESSRAGYSDGRKVTGIGVIQSDVIVFKEDGRIYRVNSNLAVSELAAGHTVKNQDSIEKIGNDIAFGTTRGISSLATVQAYGDFKTDFLSLKIGPILNGKIVRQAIWSSAIGALLILIEGSDDVFVYHSHLNAFTTFNYGIRINAICNGKDYTYFTDNTGKLFRSTNNGKDELQTGVYTEINSRLVSKTFLVVEEMELNKTRLNFEQIDATEGHIGFLNKSETEEVKLHEWKPNYSGKLYEANFKLYEWNTLLYGDSVSYFDSYEGAREQAFSFSIDISKGRAKVKSLMINYTNVSA